MKINRITMNLKCDSVLCFNNAKYELVTESFKGNQYLCENCYKKYQKLFKDFKNENK